MCRWLAYSGEPLYIEELVFKPRHSLIDQSLHATLETSTTNGDGFGIGWYGSRDIPGVYRSVRPAWNDGNLQVLASQIQSPLFLAHVRAATGTAIQQSNSHPFRHGKWLFCHNGRINEFGRIKRELALGVASELFPEICGSTDSELMFYLALTFGLEDDPVAGVERMVGFVEQVAAKADVPGAMQMTLGITDGEHIYAFRYSTSDPSRTLFRSQSMDALSHLNPAFGGLSNQATTVVSEPLGGLSDEWVEIPESTVVVVHKGDVSSGHFEPRKPA